MQIALGPSETFRRVEARTFDAPRRQRRVPSRGEAMRSDGRRTSRLAYSIALLFHGAVSRAGERFAVFFYARHRFPGDDGPRGARPRRARSPLRSCKDGL